MQTKVSHTPGPWKISSIDHAKHRAYVWTDRKYPGGFCVAEVRPETIIRDELEANAALIAAAPELLAACNQALSMIEDLPPIASMDNSRINMVASSLIAAIRKAEGGE